MKTDCCYYNCDKCTILKKLYCKTEKCSFYKKDELKHEKIIDKIYKDKYKEKEHRKNIKKKDRKVRQKMTEEEKKTKDREYGKWYYYNKVKKIQDKIKYKNYGELVFLDEEIEKLKNGKMKIRS